MSIDTTTTLQAFEILADKMGAKMDYLTKQVHEYVLLSGFIDTHEKGIMKAVNHIAERSDEMLKQTFIGKLAKQLPSMHMGINLHIFDKDHVRLIAAGVITEVLVDNGTYVIDKRVESTTVDYVKKFHTRFYLQLGGESTKNLMKGIESKPGVVYQKEVNGWKLNADEKKFLRRIATVPFCVSDVCTTELLLKGYSLKTDWDNKVDKNGRPLQEDPINRKNRFRAYAKVIIEQVKEMEAFYLPMKYCGRDRAYYEAARLDGIRPHGKFWETLMIDSAVPFDLTEVDERVLKHLIYVTLRDRVSIDDANRLFSLEDLMDAQAIDPMLQDDEDSFGEAILLNKCYQALMDYQAGRLSKFMFGYDFTNSGLLMSGVSFRSEKMMAAGNIAGANEVVDSHTAFGKGYDIDLTRKEIKGIHMGLMHGSTLKSIAKAITLATGTDTSVDDVESYNEKAYGPAVHNITNIATWGSEIVGNEQSVLRWTMPDGFSAASRAYYKAVPVLIYSASATAKEGYYSTVVMSDMPWLEDRKGFAIYGKGTQVGGVTYDVEQKKRGLYAGITHSIDAYMLRRIANAVMDSGRPILLKHDDFIAPPSAQPIVLAEAQDVFVEMYCNNMYQEAVNEIASHSPYDLEPLELVIGSGECTVDESQNFLMP